MNLDRARQQVMALLASESWYILADIYPSALRLVLFLSAKISQYLLLQTTAARICGTRSAT
jgi:hypothetical protein